MAKHFLAYEKAVERNPYFASIYNNWLLYWNAYRNSYKNRLENNNRESIGLVNFFKNVTETMSWFIFGFNGVTINIESENENLENDIQTKLDKVLDINEFKKFTNQAIISMLIFGDAFSNIGWEELTEEENGFFMKKYDLKDGYPIIELLDNFTVFPILKESDIKDIDYYIITNRSSEYVQSPKMEYYYKSHIEYYKNMDNPRPELKIENPIKGDFPITHLKNMGNPQSFFGISEFEDLFPINSEYVVKNKSFGDGIDYSVFSPLIIKGAKKKNSFVMGHREVIQGLPKDSDIEYLEHKGDLESIQKYLDKAENKFFSIAGIPDIARGKVDAISNISSAALKVLYYPLIIKTGLKRPAIDNFIEDIIWKALIYMEEKGIIDIPEDLTVKLRYPEPFPKEIDLIINEIDRRHKLGLITKKQALDLLDLEEKEINDILDKIGKEFAPQESVSNVQQLNRTKSEFSKEMERESNVLKQDQNSKEQEPI